MAIVFGPDAFTVGADTGIVVYNSTSYVYVIGATTAATVNAANDRVQQTTTSADIAVRICDPAVPTAGDGIVSADLGTTEGPSYTDSTLNLCVRMKTDNSVNFYMAYIDRANAFIHFYRVVDGAFGSAITTFTTRDFANTTRTCTFKAVTNGAQVDLTFTATGLTDCTFSDTDAARHLSGTPGFHGYATTANVAFLDNLSVDDVGAGTTPITVNNLPIDSLAGGEIV